VDPEDGEEDPVEGPVEEEVVGIVEADRCHDLPLAQGPPHLLDQRADGSTCLGRRVAAQCGKDLCKDAVFRVLGLAVYVDGDQAPRRLFHLGKDPPDRGRLAGPGQAPEGDVERVAAVEGRPEGKRDVL